MGQGLGKNSPVQLSLGRENYEALIGRHGQWIRWRIASRCPCVKGTTYAPDIHCKLCGGRGYTYTHHPKQIVMCIAASTDDSGLIQLEAEYSDDKLVKVYDFSGKVFDQAEKFDTVVDLKESVLKGNYYSFVLERNNIKSIEEVELEHNGNNYYTVPGLTVTKSNIDGVYYDAPCDIIAAMGILDSAGVEFEVEQLRLNQIWLKDKIELVYDEENGVNVEKAVEPVLPLTVQKVEYIEPYIFALLNQNLNKGDAQALVEYGGDAVCTYPYSCDVAEQDILTVLAGTVTTKEIIARTEDTYDVLPAYFVESITSVIGPGGMELIQGVDFELVGTNRIKWLSDNEPEAGEGYSVTYKQYPTYVVMQDIPQLRSSENQRFPKKAVVKFMASYAEQKKVNRQ